MTHEQTNKKILQVRELEAKAKRIQAQLDKCSNDWEAAYNKVKDTPEWSSSCHEHGVSTIYNFSDILA